MMQSSMSRYILANFKSKYADECDNYLQ